MFLVLAVLEIVFPSNCEWAVCGQLRGRTLVPPKLSHVKLNEVSTKV